MANCSFDCTAAGGWQTCVCSVCGRAVTAKKLPVHATCRGGQHLLKLPKVALGDFVESMLRGLGITKQRVEMWLKVKHCGCDRRRVFLNRWGFKQQERIERLLNKAARWYGLH